MYLSKIRQAYHAGYDSAVYNRLAIAHALTKGLGSLEADVNGDISDLAKNERTNYSVVQKLMFDVGVLCSIHSQMKDNSPLHLAIREYLRKSMGKNHEAS